VLPWVCEAMTSPLPQVYHMTWQQAVVCWRRVTGV
jgi:hypothetical protein